VFGFVIDLKLQFHYAHFSVSFSNKMALQNNACRTKRSSVCACMCACECVRVYERAHACVCFLLINCIRRNITVIELLFFFVTH
jgi:hypothetical protein